MNNTTTKTAHTPGPWVPDAQRTEWHRDGRPKSGVLGTAVMKWVGDSGHPVAWVHPKSAAFPWEGESMGDVVADARLIAAAPDLLTSAKALIDLLNDDMDEEQCAAWDAVHAAIAKAEGR